MRNIFTLSQMVNIERKKFQLKQGEGSIVGEENLKVYITKYYKKFFGAPAPSNITLSENRTDDIPQLLVEENSILMADFTKKEVHEAIS